MIGNEALKEAAVGTGPVEAGRGAESAEGNQSGDETPGRAVALGYKSTAGTEPVETGRGAKSVDANQAGVESQVSRRGYRLLLRPRPAAACSALVLAPVAFVAPRRRETPC